MKLILPLPISVNDWPGHRMALHRAKMAYQRRAWLKAVQQVRPSPNPPERVLIRVQMFVWNLRDEEGAIGSLKWVLDALRQKQRGALTWRAGIATDCGYFVDDNPARCTLGEVTQVIDRKNPRIEVTLEEIG